MYPMFADPKTYVVFKRIFGDEAHKPLLIALLNDLLELKGPRRIRSVRHFSLEQRVTAPKSKLSIVDVKCTTASGRRFVVEMQVLPVEGFEKRVVYNASKAYVMQIKSGDDYPKLCDVVGVTICDFKLWPTKIKGHGYKVPMLSRWRMQEQKSGHKGLRQIQYVFMELPKYSAGKAPETLIDKWAYFFREAKNLEVIPPALSEGPFRQALEIARRSTFTETEWEEYERAKMAEQDERGVISLARQEGHKEGHKQGLAEARAGDVLTVLWIRGIAVPAATRERILAEKDPDRGGRRSDDRPPRSDGGGLRSDDRPPSVGPRGASVRRSTPSVGPRRASVRRSTSSVQRWPLRHRRAERRSRSRRGMTSGREGGGDITGYADRKGLGRPLAPL